MAINSVLTDINKISRMVKLTATAGEGVATIVQRDQTTGALTSSYLSTYHLSLIKEKTDALAALVAGGDLPNTPYILQSCLLLCDLTGVATPLGNIAAGVEYLQVTGLIDNQAAYVVATVPHSIIGGMSAAPL